MSNGDWISSIAARIAARAICDSRTLSMSVVVEILMEMSPGSFPDGSVRELKIHDSSDRVIQRIFCGDYAGRDAYPLGGIYFAMLGMTVALAEALESGTSPADEPTARELLAALHWVTNELPSDSPIEIRVGFHLLAAACATAAVLGEL